MPWTDALLAGGFALAGVALQQGLSWRGEREQRRRQLEDRARRDETDAVLELVRAARRVQRALRDRSHGLRTAQQLAGELDRLTEAVAVVRLVVRDSALVAEIEEFEEQAKAVQASADADGDYLLQLTPLLTSLRRYREGTGAAG